MNNQGFILVLAARSLGINTNMLGRRVNEVFVYCSKQAVLADRHDVPINGRDPQDEEGKP